MQKPNFYFEKKLWKQGYKLVAGIDEVGRGCFAGPIVTAACAFTPFSIFHFPLSNEEGSRIVINDSKKLTARQRLTSCKWIKHNCLAWGIGVASVAEINRLGLARANYSAFRRAIKAANAMISSRIDYLLIDAFYIPYVRGIPSLTKRARKTKRTMGNKVRQLAIVNGDEKSLSISAASILAKVYRDKLMQKISKNPKYRKYKWGKNKGYGTNEHQEALLRYGVTRLHRKRFVETFLNKRLSSNLTI